MYSVRTVALTVAVHVLLGGQSRLSFSAPVNPVARDFVGLEWEQKSRADEGGRAVARRRLGLARSDWVGETGCSERQFG